MSVLKRGRGSSKEELIKSIDKFCELLESQDESEAIDYLKQCQSALETTDPKLENKALSLVFEAFDGEHELGSYIIQKPEPGSWTIADQLSEAGSRVLSLARRLRS